MLFAYVWLCTWTQTQSVELQVANSRPISLTKHLTCNFCAWLHFPLRWNTSNLSCFLDFPKCCCSLSWMGVFTLYLLRHYLLIFHSALEWCSCPPTCLSLVSGQLESKETKYTTEPPSPNSHLLDPYTTFCHPAREEQKMSIAGDLLGAYVGRRWRSLFGFLPHFVIIPKHWPWTPAHHPRYPLCHLVSCILSLSCQPKDSWEDWDREAV